MDVSYSVGDMRVTRYVIYVYITFNASDQASIVKQSRVTFEISAVFETARRADRFF